jgi:FkbM family methyltransferase
VTTLPATSRHGLSTPLKWLLASCVRLLRHHPRGISYLVDVCLREDLTRLARTYPSIVNSPDRHIEEAIRIVAARRTHQERVIADVGAADGHTVRRFLARFPTSRIYAFEPNSTEFQTLNGTLGADPRVVRRPVALGRHAGRSTLRITANQGSSSLLRSVPCHRPQPLQAALEEVGCETVLVSTMDLELASEARVDLIKLDVQGYELQVLAGATSVLARTDVVVVEAAHHSAYSGGAQYFELDATLRRAGFALASLWPSLFDGFRMLEWNSVYYRDRPDLKRTEVPDSVPESV